MKREIIFRAPDTNEYRVVCRFGYDKYLPNNWWIHIQKKFYYKKYIIFGEKLYKWKNTHSVWSIKQFDTKDELRQYALEYFHKKILKKQEIIKKAMSLN